MLCEDQATAVSAFKARGEMYTLSDLEAHAARVLDRNARVYYSIGAHSEQTLRDNVEAFKR